MDTPTDTPRTAAVVAAEAAATVSDADTRFVPRPVVRLAELSAEFMVLAAAEIDELRAKLDAAEHEIASLHAA